MVTVAPVPNPAPTMRTTEPDAAATGTTFVTAKVTAGPGPTSDEGVSPQAAPIVVPAAHAHMQAIRINR
jgi:hypothetical protein